MSNQVQPQQYENNEIFTFANQSVLIAFNSLMKNLYMEKDIEKRKSLAKKNKIQVSYVDLKSTGENGKRVKHDFFVDIADMKYFVDMIYESIVNPSSKNQIRTDGLKIMGGHRKPEVISNMITFNYLTKEEYLQSPANQKILNKYESDKAKYNNAMKDWKNLQIAKLQFDKQKGRVYNEGLIIPTGQRIPNANFKPYYISQQELLEFCVTMRDFINRTETMFLFETKLAEFEARLNDKFVKLYQVIQGGHNHQTSQQPTQTNHVSQTQPVQSTQQMQRQPQFNNQYQLPNQNNMQQQSTQQPAQPSSANDRQQKIFNEMNNLMSSARQMFVNAYYQQDKMGMFLDCLHIKNLTFNKETDTMLVSYTFNSEIYNIQDFQEELAFFNQYYESCLLKQIELQGKKYTIKVEPIQ